MKRTIKFYRTSDSKCYIEDFLDKQRDDLQIKILSVFKLIESLEIVPVKFLKKLTGTKLYEIRVEWKSDIYRFP
ncbi:MAG: hypothetical protein DRP60_07550 [Spirochaetes bacterium]|nr:MAG: hypothetical protein DRP60_07550 [Spirochaetota bacterium]